MKNWRLFFAVLPVIGTLASVQAAEAASAPCSSYGGCEQLDMSPPKPAEEMPAPNQPPESSAPNQATRAPTALHPEPRPGRISARTSARSADHDRNLHRPSTPQERAETRMLNREASLAAENENRLSTPPERAETRALNREAARSGSNDNRPLPGDTRRMNREASQSGRNDNRAAEANRGDDYFRTHRDYQQELRDYRAALRDYQFRTRSYSRPPAHTYAEESRPARPLPPRTNAPAVHPAPSSPDQERLDPWHGYNSGPGNGY